MGKASLLERLGLVRKPPLTVEEFRDRVIAEMLAREPDFEFRIVGEDEIEYGDGGYVAMARAYAHYRERPRELEQIVRQLAGLPLYQQPVATPETLVVLVRPAVFQGQDGDEPGLARPLAAGLIALVAVDAPERYMFSSAAGLREELAMDDAAIWDRAYANLRAQISIEPPAWPPGQVCTIRTGARLASSLVAVEAFWNHPKMASEGDLVVSPLERDQLIIARVGDDELVRSMRRLAAGFRSADFLSDRLLLRRNGTWEEFG